MENMRVLIWLMSSLGMFACILFSLATAYSAVMEVKNALSKNFLENCLSSAIDFLMAALLVCCAIFIYLVTETFIPFVEM